VSETAVAIQTPKLPDAIARRGVTEAQWRTLANNLYPGAHPDSVLMVVDYCLARKLDPLKKPCHIVPMSVKDAKTGQRGWRDVVMPGIYEYRITAMRTGLYLGHSRPEYGDEVDVAGTKAPAWCEMTFYRAVSATDRSVRIEFPVRVYFTEVVALKDGRPNERWAKAPIQMLTKCCEAAGLREAFPDEFGGEATAEEMDGQQRGDVEAAAATTGVQPAQRKSAQVAVASVVEGEVIEGDATTAAAESVTRGAAAAATTGVPTAALSLAEAIARPPVGTIVRVVEKAGGAIIGLSSGFAVQTKSADLIAAAKQLQQSGRPVEFATRPASDPTKFLPTLEEIAPVTDEAAS
jgi:phage recombination protein Bet